MPFFYQAAAVGLVLVTILLWRLQRANALANRRNLICWLALGAAMAGLLSLLVDPGSLVGLPVSVMLMLFWSAPGLAVILSRPQRLAARLEYSLNRGDLETARKLMAEAVEAVSEASPVDADWHRAELERLRTSLAQLSRQLSQDAPATNVSDTAASVPCESPDTTSARIL